MHLTVFEMIYFNMTVMIGLTISIGYIIMID